MPGGPILTPEKTVQSKPSFLAGNDGGCLASDSDNPFDQRLESSEDRVLHRADFQTINQVVQTALLRMVVPKLNALHERLGIEPMSEALIVQDLSEKENCVPWPESPPAPRRSSISSTRPIESVSMIVENASLKDSEPRSVEAADVHEASKNDGEALTPSASLRRWLAKTTDVQHRNRLKELIQEADEFGCTEVTPSEEKAEKLARKPVESLAHHHHRKSPNSSPGQVCHKPLKECLFEEAGVRLEDSLIEKEIALQEKPTTTPCSDKKSNPKALSIESATALLEELLRTKAENDFESKPDVQERVPMVEEMKEAERKRQDQSFEVAFEQLRQELLSNMTDLKEQLQAIPELTERKVTSRLLRPAKSVMYGPRELPGLKAACFADYFKHGRPKKEKERVEQLLSNLLVSVDGLKSDFRDSEVQRLMGQTAISPEKSAASSPTPQQRRTANDLPRLMVSPRDRQSHESPIRDTESIRSFATLEMMNSPSKDVQSRAFPGGKNVGEISIERPLRSPRGARPMSSTVRPASLPAALSTVGKMQK